MPATRTATTSAPAAPGRSRRDRRRRGLRTLVAGVATAATVVVLGGCSAAGLPGADGRVAVDYWLWESLQLPGYQKCADAFEAQNDDIEIRITQYGWADYWQKLTAGLVAGAGPDVFTDHLTKYPEFVNRGVILPLDDFEATADLDPADYQEGLAELWTGQDGKQYGSPKDFDTIALFYDENVLAEAGYAPEDLEGLTWDPETGGTFEQVVAHLSVDAAGVRGDEPGFDPTNVVTYGLGSNGAGDTNGQTQWAWLAGATGWELTNAPVWGDEYHYDDPRFQASIGWLFGLVDKGFFPSYERVGSAPNPVQQLGSGQAALVADGSWTISSYLALDGVDLGVASVPAGPIGHPVSMYNGLGDSISAQTAVPDEAARWVEFLGGSECQTIVGEQGVVFPARPEGTDAAKAAFAEKGVDVEPFTDLVDDGNTVLYPVTDNAAEILSIMKPVMDGIYIGSRDVESLDRTNEQVNSLFE